MSAAEFSGGVYRFWAASGALVARSVWGSRRPELLSDRLTDRLLLAIS